MASGLPLRPPSAASLCGLPAPAPTKQLPVRLSAASGPSRAVGHPGTDLILQQETLLHLFGEPQGHPAAWVPSGPREQWTCSARGTRGRARPAHALCERQDEWVTDLYIYIYICLYIYMWPHPWGRAVHGEDPTRSQEQLR